MDPSNGSSRQDYEELGFFKAIFHFLRFCAAPRYELQPSTRVGLDGMFGIWMFVGVLRFGCLLVLASFSTPSPGGFGAMRNVTIKLMIALVVAPVLEELAFRGPLRASPTRLGTAAAIITFLNIDLNFITRLLAGFGCGVAVYFLGNRYDEVIQQFYARHFRWIFYGTAVFFAWGHISARHSAMPNANVAITLIVLQHTLFALAAGYIRVRNGLAASVVFHSMHNAFVAWIR